MQISLEIESCDSACIASWTRPAEKIPLVLLGMETICTGFLGILFQTHIVHKYRQSVVGFDRIGELRVIFDHQFAVIIHINAISTWSKLGPVKFHFLKSAMARKRALAAERESVGPVIAQDVVVHAQANELRVAIKVDFGEFAILAQKWPSDFVLAFVIAVEWAHRVQLRFVDSRTTASITTGRIIA